MTRRRSTSLRQSESIRLTTIVDGTSSSSLLLAPRDVSSINSRDGMCAVHDISHSYCFVLAPKMSWLESSRGLSVLSSFLHLALVATHLALLVVWFQRSEHRFVFAVEHERFVSRAIKVILTTFGTVRATPLMINYRFSYITLHFRFIRHSWSS
jgi:hypothetical protein